MTTIFDSSLFRQHAASQQKVRTPFEFAVSSVRALRASRPTGGYTADATGAELLSQMNRLGMSLFNREEPDGWSEYGADWINTSSLMERMRFVQQTLLREKRADPVGLVKLKVPSAKWRDAGAVTDYFLEVLYPGEGKANLASTAPWPWPTSTRWTTEPHPRRLLQFGSKLGRLRQPVKGWSPS